MNADAFRIKCEDKNKTFLWEKTFAGMYDENHSKNKVKQQLQSEKKIQVILVADTPNFDNYGRHLQRKGTEKKENRLSIDILGFDSTSRTMFQRHMPRTWETMHRLGFEVLFGYNKVERRKRREIMGKRSGGRQFDGESGANSRRRHQRSDGDTETRQERRH